MIFCLRSIGNEPPRALWKISMFHRATRDNTDHRQRTVYMEDKLEDTAFTLYVQHSTDISPHNQQTQPRLRSHSVY